MTYNLYNPNQWMQQEGALEYIVTESIGGMALEVAIEEGEIRSAAEGVQAMLVTIWGLEENKCGEQVAQNIMGEHVDILNAGTTKTGGMNTCHAGWW